MVLFYAGMFNSRHIDGLVQDCSNSIANALELLKSWTKPSLSNNNILMLFWLIQAAYLK